MNFEEISKKVKQFGKDTMTEVQKLNEVRQLNGRINDEKKKITHTYTEMGKRIYEMYKENPPEGFEADMEAIEECIRMIDLLQDQIRNVKGVVLCPCCNMEVNAAERFCSNCGNKMPEVITVSDEEENIVDSVIETEESVEAEDLAAEAEAMEAEFDAELADETVEEIVEEAAEPEATAEEAEEAAESEAAAEEAEAAEEEK